MRKKITKVIEKSIPRVYDEEGDEVDRRDIANKIYDSIPGIERLEIEPFQQWIPMACSTCHYNEARKLGCSYPLLSENVHRENPPPEDCPNGYS